MALLNNLAGFQSEVPRSNGYVDNDFSEGMIFTEYVNGVADKDNAVVLFGTFMPKDKLSTGISQKVVKEHYVGNPYPVVHVNGAEEDDIEITGTFNEYHIQDLSLKGAATAYKEKFDFLAKRGNVVKITLGDYFSKYCIIQNSKFDMYHLKKIDYKISILVIGDKLPANYYLTESSVLDTKTPNNELISKVAEHLKLKDQQPASVPVTLSDTINNIVSEVAEKISFVTNFVDGVLTDTEQILDSAYKAVGLIQNAKSFIVKSNRRLGLIQKQLSGENSIGNDFNKTLESLKNTEYHAQLKKSNRDLLSSLTAVQNVFINYTKAVPLRKHVVGQSDSLQRISVKYYGSPDNWIKIMNHNKLQTTDLVAGSIIEIPRI